MESRGDDASPSATSVPSPSSGVSVGQVRKQSAPRKAAWQKKSIGSASSYGVEAMAKEAREAGQRIEATVYRGTAQRLEEESNHVQDLVARGVISKEQAHKLQARARMHEKRDAEISRSSTVSLSKEAAAAADYETTERMLENLLNVEDKNPIVRAVKHTLGIYTLERKVRVETLRRNAPGFRHPYPRVHRAMSSTYTEVAIGVLMCVNGILIGVQTSLSGTNADIVEISGYRVSVLECLEHFFTGFFVIEIICRFMAKGWTWIMSAANFADFALIVFTGVLPMWILGPAGVNPGMLRTVQVLRVLRLIRLVRMVRMVPWFRILWDLIRGILDSRQIIGWTYVVIGSVIYMFAVIFTYAIGRSDVFTDDAYALEHFADVGASMVTLFQTLTLDSWSFVARPLMAKSWIVCALFICVIMVLTLILMNLVTAVIVNNAIDRKKADQELLAQLKREEMKQEIEELGQLFQDMDEDGSGMMSKDEYMKAASENETVKTKFTLMEIGPTETEEIWEFLDDGQGEISVGRFTDCLRSMAGEAKAKDSFSIVQRVKKVLKTLRFLEERVDRCTIQGDGLRQRVVTIESDLAQLFQEAREFIAIASKCVPSAPSQRPLAAVCRREAQLHESCSRRVANERKPQEEDDDAEIMFQDLAAGALRRADVEANR